VRKYGAKHSISLKRKSSWLWVFVSVTFMSKNRLFAYCHVSLDCVTDRPVFYLKVPPGVVPFQTARIQTSCGLSCLMTLEHVAAESGANVVEFQHHHKPPVGTMIGPFINLPSSKPLSLRSILMLSSHPFLGHPSGRFTYLPVSITHAARRPFLISPLHNFWWSI
jgi:hypothetical protein